MTKNKEILDFLKQYALEKYNWNINKPREFHELLNEETIVYEENAYSSRHWEEVDKVAEIDNTFISFTTAYTTGDLTPHEKGWEFDLDSIHEAEQHEETRVVVTYVPKSAV